MPSLLRPGLTLFIVRHGETDWNAAARYQGQRDIPLNDHGRAQAHRNGEALARHLGPAAATLDFVSSPLGRTRETMEILRRAMGLDPAAYRLDARLRELNYGHWEGQLAKDLPTTDPVGLAERRLGPFDWRPRDGESYADLGIRTDGWLADISRDTVAVTHGGVSRTLRGTVLGLIGDEVPFLPVPQDRVLVLRDGTACWI